MNAGDAHGRTAGPSAANLLDQARSAFAIIGRHGFTLEKATLVSPDSFKGGFVMDYAAQDRVVVVTYLDSELSVTLDGEEVFGHAVHEPFAGNMFSRSSLSRAMGRIAAAVAERLDR